MLGILAITLALQLLTPHAGAELPVVAPGELAMNAEQLEKIDGLVAKEIEARKLPGCVVAVGRTGGVGFLKAYGLRQIKPDEEKMTLDTVFDMASITKPTATATSIMILVERGLVRLRSPVAEYIPEFAANGKDQITIEQLLTHQSGLVPDNPLKDYEDGAERAWERVFALKPQAEPGTKFMYSDVNFLVLGEVIRRVTGYDVAEFSAANVFRPLGMNETMYRPGEVLARRAAPSEQRDGRWLRGEVHDPRAALLGGVAGHAGLFSTAADLAVYCDALLRGSGPGSESPRIMSRATLAEMTRPRDIHGDLRALGWDSKTGFSSNRGELFSPRAFGHGGFTGTAMWIDPDLDLFVIFLSNRLHPDGTGLVNPLAGKIGAVAAAAITGANPLAGEGEAKTQASGTPEGDVQTGIDVLARTGFIPVKGRRVGLITNHTGLDRSGKRSIDLLHEAESVELVAIFSPEHGIAGALDHDGIADSKDEKTGVPILSLYGDSRKPSAEQLKDIDVLVFDIQDIGARIYTYPATMLGAMEEAGKLKKRFVVLDRPNPIGGMAVEGPVRDEGRDSFVAWHTVPLRHGLTMGELATMYKAERKLDVDLTVVGMENWRRGEYFDSTGLTWINPSPNMRSLTEALLYPGIGMLEFTNVSVGRGTGTPFEVLGAPWIDGQELAKALNGAGLKGIGFVPIEFTPTASKFANEKCGGVNFVVIDRDKLEPVSVGLEIACTLRRLYGDQWEVDRLDKLLANRNVLEAIRGGADRKTIETLIRPDLEKYKERRREFLLYPE